ncbi:hypothetical protein [Chryseobacterium sp.]|uniref:hypothetical protein n=1 Tax=Chryseobacterium sp. TaxID=1871047 RepID=UPI0025B81660|nr:hypothetical protein [Chryseobacterium sp.]MBV8325755.1 hypothetical protein [Chryseobacterium sp.]
MKNIELIDLTENECLSISGGESAWYWVAYGARRAVAFMSDVNDSIQGGGGYYQRW